LWILDDGEAVWDSLAIGEAIAEQWPEAGTWPEAARLRRMARSACAEMHSGFPDMRRVLTCNARRRYDPGLWRRVAGDGAAAVEADLARVHALWASLLDASGGPYLAGPKPTYVDAFFAPVVSRFVTYRVASPDDLVAYRDAVEALPAWGRWMIEAAKEPEVIEKYEYPG
jgi:glutathione S-transferase